MYLMAIEDEFERNKVNFSYDEFLKAFQKLDNEFKGLMSKHILVKKKNIKLYNHVQQFSLDYDTLNLEYKNLIKELNDLKSNIDSSTLVNDLKNENESLKKKSRCLDKKLSQAHQ